MAPKARKCGPKGRAALSRKSTSRPSLDAPVVSETALVALVSESVPSYPTSPAEKKGSHTWTMQRDIDRIIKGKLGFVDPLEIQSRRSNKGVSVRQYLEAFLAMNSHKSGSGVKRQCLNAGFWADFFVAFGFKNPGFYGLKDVDAAEVTLNDEYFEVMSVCNSENPTVRSEDPLCDYHKNLKDITEPNLIALFHASVHSRLVTLKMAYKMQMSLAKLCGRLEVSKRFPGTWKAVVEKLDSVLTWHWQQKESQDSFVDRSIWVQTNHEAVFSMINKDDFDACERACVEKMDCPGEALQSMMRTSLGQALFHNEARQYQMNSFIDRCHKRADDLMHNGFSEETVQGYHEASDVECKHLAASGHRMFGGIQRQISFLNFKVHVFPTSVYDLKDWILDATVRSVAISNGQLPRLPWEKVLWENRPLQHFGMTVQVPEFLLTHGRNARLVMSKIAGEWGPGRTLATMQRDVSAHQKDILDTNRSTSLEIAFLLQQVPAAADAWANEEVFRILGDAASPTKATTKEDMLICLSNIKKLKNDRRYACLPNTTGQDIDAIILLLVSNQEGPAHRMRISSAGTSTFMQRALDCIGSWLKIVVPGKKASSKLALPNFVQGQAAAHHLFVKLDKLDVHLRDEEDLLQLRNYQWLLGGHSRDVLDTWIEELVRKTKQDIVNAAMIEDAPSTASASSGCKAVASSSSSGTLALKVTMFAPPKKGAGLASSKKQKLNDNAYVSMKEKMMKICCGRPS